ncbi:ABC transporter substrate-binding protein [Cohnella sp.]|uniref:SgrR family transcriptional regulator n=1 Tax=Cohnella sp. TaxID=1883426 RepID=UPI00356250C7
MFTMVERYFILLNKFGDSEKLDSTVEVSMDELALAFYCSTRNVKIIIRKLTEEGLISWQAGRGRGNLSKLTFNAEKEPLLMEWAQQMSRRGEYKQAFELLQTYSQSHTLKERFVHWLNTHFGYEAEKSAGSAVIDTFRLPVYRSGFMLDPSQVYYCFDSHLIRQLFDRLVSFDTSANHYVPCLAHAWEVNVDATEWIFYLRKGIRFHHGRELTSEDVQFTLERMRGNKPHSWMVRNMKQVDCLGPRTVKVILEKPNRIFLRYLCSAAMSIVPKDLIQEDEPLFWKHPFGTGPFQLLQWTEDRFELAANPSYYSGRAHLDRVVLAFMPEDTALMSNSAEWQQLLSDHNQWENKSESDWKTIEALCKGCSLMSWNLGKPGPQQSSSFRRAFDLLIDRKEMIRHLGEDRMYPAHGFRPTEQTPHLEDRLNIEEAKRLLHQSGYDGTPLTLSTYGHHDTDACWIQRRCAEFGIKVNIKVESKQSIREPEALKNTDGIVYAVVFAEDEVCEIENYEQYGNFLRELLHPEMLKWVEQQTNLALAAERPEERREILNGIEHRLREEAHVIFLLHKKLDLHMHTTVKGVGLNSLGWIDFKDIWLEKRAIGS